MCGKVEDVPLKQRKSHFCVLDWGVQDGAAVRLSFWKVLPRWRAAELM